MMQMIRLLRLWLSRYQCRKAARRGYAIAEENLRETAKAIKGVSDSLSKCLMSLENGSVRTPEVVSQLKEQLSRVVTNLENLQRKSELHLEERRKHLDVFSITIFGRTMTGKSTLMEILTHGDGQSIGAGAQRTTRDIRRYQWNGLEILDVPGIAAFEGEGDQEIAFKAASQADLVLFLITDDAPQPVEAECLAQIRRLGKPVLGICNVKTAINDEEDLLLFLQDSDSFDQSRIDELLAQFHLFADQHIPGMRIPFVVSHLLSRFLAYQPDYKQHRGKLLKTSRFDAVESCIVDEVIRRGPFLSVKSFVDESAAPMMELTDQLFDFSAQNTSSERVLGNKIRQLRNWEKDFKSSGQERINTLISKSMDALRDEAYTFAEDHYDDRHADKNWKRLVETSGVIRKVEKLQKELLDECNEALREVARELESEISLVTSLSSDRYIRMDTIFDLKRAWNWGTNILAGGLGIAALVLGIGPLGLAAVVVGIGGWLISLLFDDREKQVRGAREKLRRMLDENINKMEGDLRKKIGDWFQQELLKKMDAFLDDLEAVKSGVFALADTQLNLAQALNKRQKELEHILVKEALNELSAQNLLDSIVDVARVPGFAIMLLIRPNVVFPEQIRRELENLLDEQIWFVIDTKNEFSILTQAIGRNCEKSKISIEEKIHVAHVHLDNLDVVTKARVRLARQLTGLNIIKQREIV